jgi:hypothetical protein
VSRITVDHKRNPRREAGGRMESDLSGKNDQLAGIGRVRASASGGDGPDSDDLHPFNTGRLNPLCDIVVAIAVPEAG